MRLEQHDVSREDRERRVEGSRRLGCSFGRGRVHDGLDHVRVPRENLLDRFGGVDAKGEYHSTIPGDSKRFFTMLGTLVAGRVSVACAALSAAKSGLTIAVRYGDMRRQFGPVGAQEVRLLDHQTHQLRLLKPLAKTYALDFALFCKKGNLDVETDGDLWHADPQRIPEDNRRNNDLAVQGYKILRFDDCLKSN